MNDLDRPNVPESCIVHLKPTIRSTNGVAAIRCQRRALSRSLRDYFLGCFSIVDSPESADTGAKWLEAQWRGDGLCVF